MGNFGEGKQVSIRKLMQEDYSIYREVTYADFSYKNIFTEKFMQGIWKASKSNSVSRYIAEKLGGKLISEQPTMEQWIIDYGKKTGALKEEEVSYVCTYRIEKM